MVEAEIKPDRLADFLDIIERDAIGSRTEPGCIRFGKFVVLCFVCLFVCLFVCCCSVSIAVAVLFVLLVVQY